MDNILLTPQVLETSAWLSPVFLLFLTLGAWSKSDMLLRPLSTYIHEMGHAFTAMLLGRKVTRIKVRFWFGGHTDYVGAKGLGNLLISWSGYAAPGYLALGLAFGIYSGYLHLLSLPFAIAALLAILLQRTITGLIYSLIYAGMLILASFYFNTSAVSILILVLLGLISGHGLFSVFKLKAIRTEVPTQSEFDKEISDSEMLERWTKVPAGIWETSWIIFIAVSIVALNAVILI